MNKNIPGKLIQLLENADKKLAQAQDARKAVIEYIEENYGVELYESGIIEKLEDDLTWCFGLKVNEIEKLIQDEA